MSNYVYEPVWSIWVGDENFTCQDMSVYDTVNNWFMPIKQDSLVHTMYNNPHHRTRFLLWKIYIICVNVYTFDWNRDAWSLDFDEIVAVMGLAGIFNLQDGSTDQVDDN